MEFNALEYPPSHHQDNDRQHMIEVMRSYPLATLISVEDNAPLITHLPLIYNNGTLVGHIDKFNPQAGLLKDGKPVTIIFSGPQCYISPTVYASKHLPTWNYIYVHLKGKVKAIADSQKVKQSIVAMTEFLEAPEHRFVLQLDDPRMDALIDYIVGFEIEITDWEGKFKLSQDKHPKDIRLARAELIKRSQREIEGFMDRVFKIS